MNKKQRKAFAAGRLQARSEYSLWYTNLPEDVKRVITSYQREQYVIRQTNRIANFDRLITFDFSADE